MRNFLTKTLPHIPYSNVSWAVLRLTFCMVCALAALPLGARETERPLRVGLIEFGPLVVYRDNEPSGPLFDYAQEVLNHADMPLQFHQVSINRGIEDLKNNQLDLVLTLFKTPERQFIIHFSQQPLLTVNTGICTRNDLQTHPLTANSRLAHVRGTIIPPAIRGMTLAPITGDKTQLRMLQMLMMGRVDAIFSPKPEILQLTAYEARFEQPIHCYEIRDSRTPIHIGFSKALPQAVIKKIEEGLQKKQQECSFDSYLASRMHKAGMKAPALTLITPSSQLAHP